LIENNQLALQADLRFHSTNREFPDLPPSGHLRIQFQLQPDTEDIDKQLPAGSGDVSIAAEQSQSTDDVIATTAHQPSTLLPPPQKTAQLGAPIPVERVDPRWHRYRFSVDLRSIANCREHLAGLTLRTSFPPLTKDHPVSTYPPIHVYPTIENLIPHSLCSFEFRMDRNQLAAYFDSVPLRIEVIQQQQQQQLPDRIIAAGEQLIPILQQPTERIVGPHPNLGGSSQLYTASIELFPERPQSEGGGKLGDLSLILHLEDFGVPIQLPEQSAEQSQLLGTPVITATQMEQETFSRSVHAPLPHHRAVASPPHPTKRGVSPAVKTRSTKPAASSPVVAKKTPIRRTKEYKTALALEQWKSAERNQFEKKMAVEEQQLMQAEAREWAHKEAERDEAIRKKMAELEAVEDRVRTTLRSLEAREKALALREREMELRKTDLEHQYERFLQDSKDVSRRMHDDHAALLKAENQKIVELEAQKQELLDEKAQLSAKYDGLQQEHQAAQQRHRQSIAAKQRASSPAAKPAHATEMDLMRLQNEKRNLETQIKTIEQSKQYYKQAWVKAVHDLVQLRKQTDDSKRNDLEKEMRELEHMRLRYLSQEEAELMMRHNASSQFRAAAMTTDGMQESEHDKSVALAPEQSAEIQRLERERDSLLSSGVYQPEDRLIRLLQDKIDEFRVK
jgi:hypothetical protein